MVEKIANRRYFLCLVALLCIFLRTWLVNDLFVPTTDAYGLHWTTLSTLLTVGLYLAVATLARFRPRSLPYRQATALSLAVLCVTPLASFFGQGNEPVAVTAFIAGSLASVWIAIRVFPAFCSLETPYERNTCICFAYFLGCVAQLLLKGNGFLELAVLTLIPFVTIAALGKPARATFEAMRSNAAAADIAPLHPDSFLPPGHALFGCIVFCQAASGFAIGPSYQQMPGSALALIGLVPLAAGIRYNLSGGNDPSPAENRFFQTYVLVTTAGYLAIIVGTEVSVGTLASTVLSLGSALFNVLLWMCVVAIGTRNRLDSVWVFSWCMGASTLGLLLGRTLDNALSVISSDNPPVTLTVLSIALFCFLACYILVLKDFNIVRVIYGVRPLTERSYEPSSPAANPEETVERMLNARCQKLAQEYSLTERESEVLELLASGANARYVQDKLVISYHTVRTHIKHIYTKLDVHNREELIAVLQRKPHGDK